MPKKLRILFVEPDENGADLVRESLSPRHFEVLNASSLVQMEELMRTDGDFDLVILDVGRFGPRAREVLARATHLLESRVPLQPVIDEGKPPPIGVLPKSELRGDRNMGQVVLSNIMAMLERTLQSALPA